jgi:hypothetical protein
MARRFYQAKFDNGRPLFFEDFGQLVKISGIIVQGMGETALLLAPTAVPYSEETLSLYTPTIEEWARILAETDDPKILEMEPDGVNVKAIHRKVRHQISGAVQQKVWVRDGLRCAFCQLDIGKAQLTVDHWMPLELGGKNDTSNYITACRKCNKMKGSAHPRDFCVMYNHDYDRLYAMTQRPIV